MDVFFTGREDVADFDGGLAVGPLQLAVEVYVAGVGVAHALVVVFFGFFFAAGGELPGPVLDAAHVVVYLTDVVVVKFVPFAFVEDVLASVEPDFGGEAVFDGPSFSSIAVGVYAVYAVAF